MQGRRVYIDDEGGLPLKEGDYGQEKDGTWSVRPPGQSMGGIPRHEVEEHGDGTITVTPSIVLKVMAGDRAVREVWHGWLKCGIWTEV